MPFLKIKAECSSEMLIPHAVLHCITCAEILPVLTAVRTSNLTKQNHVVETANAICTFIFLSLYSLYSVCMAKHFNVKVFSEANNKDTSMQ